MIFQTSSKGTEDDKFDKIEGKSSLPFSNNSDVQEPSQQQLNSLMDLYNQNRLKQVFKEAQTLTKLYTKNLFLWNLLGSAAAQLGQLDEAVIAFQKTVSLAPDYAEAYNNLGNALHDQGKFGKAIKAYKKAISIKPDYAEAYSNMGNALQDQSRFEEAINVYKKATSTKPDYAEAHYNMGICLRKQDRLEEALEAYKKAAVANPFFAEIHNNMGNLLQEQGNFDDAIEAFKKATSIKPDYAEAHTNMGIVYYKHGKTEAAISAYQNAITTNPNYAEAYYNIGICLTEQGNVNEAVNAYKKATLIKPHYAEAHNNMGNALHDKGKLEEALSAYNKAISIKPDYAETYCNIGITLNFQNKLDEALEAFNTAININPNYAEAYFNIGLILQDQGKPQEAIEAYNKVLSLNPNHLSTKHMISALTGNTNEIAPREYVENLFDGYAQNFEISLVNKLAYKTPELIKDILTESDSKKSLGNILDLGCGTGLLGTEIKNHCSRLDGIDLSNKMLMIANQKNIYDNLNQYDLVEYLSSMPLDFDYYIACDVFVYIGDLSEIFRLIKSRNSKACSLVFSTEHTEKDGYHILKTGRYSHSKSYIESLCIKFGYNISHFSTSNLRKEKGSFIKGGIYALSFEQ